jgi:phosphoglucomutase
MSQHPRAGTPALPEDLVDIAALLRAYEDVRPDPSEPTQRVAFGTSGHRGSAFRAAFNEAHIIATTEAICRYRAMRGYTGPLFIGRDTHALSEPAWRTALEVLVARGVDVRVDAGDGYTPTPAVSHAIIVANRDRWTTTGGKALADGIVVTPSHNPPDDGGFKYIAQPARRRRLQVQPAQRRPSGHRRHALDPGRGEPDPRELRS